MVAPFVSESGHIATYHHFAGTEDSYGALVYRCMHTPGLAEVDDFTSKIEDIEFLLAS